MNLAVFIMSSVPLLITYYANQYYQADLVKTLEELEPELNLPRIRSYDFIIVGGGTAGCLVAGRLSEKYNVLLLEAGGSPVPASQVPAFVIPVGYDPATNYEFVSIPQPNAGQANGGIMVSSLGKMLGGGGSHNDMVHNRGSPYDFDNWARLVNDSSWTYEAVLEYFKKGEDFVGVLYDNGHEGYYGYDGPLKVDTDVPPILPLWFEAAHELGYKIGDPNGYQAEGFTPLQKLIHSGHRVSTYNSFIKPYEGQRANLTVIRYAQVSQVLIDDNLKVYGVEFVRHGILQRAYATKEVVISCGAVASPLLLMKSGIGPEDVLTEAGIPVKLHRPGVGQNLGEHAAITLSPFYVNDSSLFPRIYDGEEDKLEGYHETGSGPLGILQEGPQALFVSTLAKETGEEGWPDISVTIDVTPKGPIPNEREYFIVHVVAARSKNRGSVLLNGTAYKEGVRDDTKLAMIDFQLLTDPADVDVLIEGIKLTFKILEETTPFQKLNTSYSTEPFPACIEHEFRSDEYWKCLIRQKATNWLHLVGSCSMGRENDLTSVVDSKLKVIGVDGLRVIDASVMPVVPNANTNAPTIMVAEKGVDEIFKMYDNDVKNSNNNFCAAAAAEAEL